MKILLELDVPDDFETGLSMQKVIEDEIAADRWTWRKVAKPDRSLERACCGTLHGSRHRASCPVRVQACRSEDRALLATPAGAELVRKAAEAAAREVLRASSAWQPIETAPMAVLCLVAVVGPGGERRVFVSETSHEGGSWRWLSTVGWTGWGQMHGSWMPTHWQPLPAPPEAAA